MKLYTKESLKNIYLQGWYDGSIGLNNIERQEDAISYVTPIELPSDEEIGEATRTKALYDCSYETNFRLGAKWTIEQILKQNK